MYRVLGLAHATIHHDMTRLRARLADQSGQGTVEYVGLLVLIGGLIGAVAMIKFDGKDVASAIVNRLKDAIDTAGKGK
jgi:hypothetical protein